MKLRQAPSNSPLKSSWSLSVFCGWWLSYWMVGGCGAQVTANNVDSGLSDINADLAVDGYDHAESTASDVLPQDSGLRCQLITESPLPQHPCDAQGRRECDLWVRSFVDAGVAYSQCVAGPFRCVRADHCADHDLPNTCHCGDGLACGVGEVCIAINQDAPPRCACISSLP